MPDAQSSNGIPTLFIYAQATRQITILKIERYKYYLRPQLKPQTMSLGALRKYKFAELIS